MRKGQFNKVSYDRNYFEKIDSKEKAYFLGLFTADGWVIYNPEKYKYNFSILLKDKDFHIIQDFANHIGFNNKFIRKIIKGKKYSGISITNKKFVEDLIIHGICQNKSLTLKTPKIEEKYKSHFYRGLFDGDGHIKCNSRVTMSICGAFDIIKDFSHYCNNIIANKGNFYQHQISDIYYYGINGRNVIKVLDTLYCDCNLFLKRKHDIYLSAKNKLNKFYKNQSSKYKGVYYDKIKKRYRASATLNYKKIHIGDFKVDKDAALAYNDFVIKNNLNRELNIIKE